MFDGLLERFLSGLSTNGPFLWFALLLLAVGAARIAELMVAKRFTSHADDRGEQPKPEPIFKIMVFLHVLPFVLSPLEVLILQPKFYPALAGVSFAFLAIAGFMRIWTLSTLGRNWNVRIVSPEKVIQSGPYAFIRHPNYAIVITELFFIPLFGGAYFTCALLTLLNAFVLFKRIPAEEKVLFEMPGYADAFEKKARFIPGVI